MSAGLEGQRLTKSSALSFGELYQTNSSKTKTKSWLLIKETLTTKMEGTVGRDFVVTNSSSNSIGTKKRTVSQRFSIGPKAARFIAVIIFGALGLLYLTQSTQGADRSYKIRELTSEKSQLSEERDRLKIEESRLESLNEIDKALNPPPAPTEETKMQPTNQINYLPAEKVAAL